MKWFDQKCTCVSCGGKYTTRTMMKQSPEHQTCAVCTEKQFPYEDEN